MLAACIAGLTACRDEPVVPRSTVTSPVASGPASLVACDPTTGCPDPADTHVSATITLRTTIKVTTSAPIIDPATGQSTTTISGNAPDVHVAVDAGYTTAGAVKVRTNFTDGADPNTNLVPQTVAADLTADALTEINPNSQALTDTPPSEMSATSPMAIVGSTANGDVTAGLLVDQNDTTPVSASRGALGGPVADRAVADRAVAERLTLSRAIVRAAQGGAQLAVLNGIPVRVERSRPDRLVLTDAIEVSAADVRAQLGDAAAPQNAPAAAASAGKATHTRTFAKVDVDDVGNPLALGGSRRSGRALWVLQEDRTEADDDNGGRQLHQTHSMLFSNVRWFRNPDRDAARRAARPSRAWIPLANGGTTSPGGTGDLFYDRGASPGGPSAVRAPTGGFHALVACDNNCVSGGTVSTGPAPIGATPSCSPEVQAHVNTAGDVNLLFQHGFASDATTWCDGSAYLRSRFVVRNEVRHSLNAGDYYENQAHDLEQRLRNDAAAGFAGPYVFVGHSNGGIVSRFASQDFGTSAGLVRGVVTVSTPHGGAPIVNLPKATMVALMAVPVASKLSCAFVNTFLCNQGTLTSAETGLGLITALSFFYESGHPVLTEMTPSNSFQRFVNGRGDPVRGVAVVNQSWDKWTEWRLIGDRHYCGAAAQVPNCGDLGRLYVNNVDKTYHRYIKCAVVGGILGFFLPGGHAVAAACGLNAAGLKTIDWVYHRVTVGNDQGDGVVPVGSQRYPGDPQPYVVSDADSHLAETHAQRRTLVQVANAINGRYGVPLH